MADTVVKDVSIIQGAFPASSMLDLCRETMGFIYNTIHDNPHMDTSYLKNIYFGAREDKRSLFEISLDDNVFTFDQNSSLSDLDQFKKDDYHDRMYNVKWIAKVDDTLTRRSFDIKKRYLLGPEVILSDVFYIRDMPKLKPASIKIESRSLRNAFYDHRNSGIFFEELPKDNFDKLVDTNKELDLGYNIYANEN